VLVVGAGEEDTQGEGWEAVIDETVDDSTAVVVVEEAGGVEMERGGREVGEVAEDEEEGEGVGV
jgi:hypothetical protein